MKYEQDKTFLRQPFSNLHWQSLLMYMYNCLKNKFSSQSCTCKWHVWSSPLHAHISGLNITEETNSFRLIVSVLSSISFCKGSGPFFDDKVLLLFSDWEAKSSSLTSMTASNRELKKCQEKSSRFFLS